MVIKETIYTVPGKGEFEGKDREVKIRCATHDDAQMLIDYLRDTCGETRFLVKEPEEITMTLEQEYQFIDRNNESENNLLLLGFIDGEYVGNCSIMGNGTLRFKHRATIGIAFKQKYTNLGIGKIMLGKVIETAKEMGLEQLELEVVANNARAIHVYESLGFKITGTLPDNMKYKDGTYADCYFMVKKL